MKALVYTRIRTKAFYHYVSSRVFGEDNVKYFSDDKWCESINLMERFYKCYNNYEKCENINFDASSEELQDIVSRCRFLRSVNPGKCNRAIYCMWTALTELMDEHNPDIVFGLPVDSYVLDILYRLCKRRGIRYLSVVPTLVNGYIRFTSRGETIRLRDSDETEVNEVLNMLLSKNYIPKHIKSKEKSPFEIFYKYYLKDKIKKIVFRLLMVVNRDPMNFYLNSHFSNEYLMICDNIRNIFPYEYFDKEWDKTLNVIKGNKIIVYMPLQFYPETSTDYWTTNSELIDYYRILYRAIDVLRDNAVILVKEHPSAMGYRSINIYKELSSRSNVILVPSHISSLELIKKADIAITWGTSTAVEARIRNKPVITFGTPFFNAGNCYTIIDSFESIETIPSLIEQEINNNRNCDIKELIKFMLDSSCEGIVYPGAIDFSKTDKVKKANADNIIYSMNKYMDSILKL